MTIENTAPATSDKASFELVLESVAAQLAASPVKVSENKGWVKIESLVNGHKTYVAKQKAKALVRIETTVDLSGLEGFEPLAKPNGRVAGTITPELLGVALEVMADAERKIRAPLRAPKAKAEAVSVEA